MKILKRSLKKMIRESLLLELFKNLNPYPFSSQPDIIHRDMSDVPVEYIYVFKADDGSDYRISFKHIDIIDSDISNSFSLNKKMYWDVQFYSMKQSKEFLRKERDYSLTNKNDMRVLHTVIEVTKTFVKNVLPELEDLDQRETREFISECNSEYDGDDRRAKVYQYMLKKQGIASEIAEVNASRYYMDRGHINKREYYIKFEV
jgi:hypothetical protein